jgi:hypothetical protein
MAQVGEHLPGKCKAKSSNTSTKKKKITRNERGIKDKPEPAERSPRWGIRKTETEVKSWLPVL